MGDQEEQVPRQLGSYRVIAKLGSGGMASVFLGMQSGMAKFKKLVVLKLLHSKFTENTEFLDMFLNEARLAARLNHPNVVNTYEVGEDDGHHFIAMEYLEGQPYSAIIKKLGRGNVDLAHVLKVLVDTLGGLHYAHELRDFDGTPLGVVHRDVNPQNIFVTYDGNVKLVDFGVAKAACSDNETRAGVIKGKVAYLAPEQAGTGPIDRRADIFSVGVMLWEALAGKRFSSGTIDVATIHRRVMGEEPRIRDIVPDAASDLADICDRAIALRPADRFPTALEMRTALESVLETRRRRSKAHSLAVLVTETFANERSSIKTVIEQHARFNRSEPPATSGQHHVPVIAPRIAVNDGSGSMPSIATGTGSVSAFNTPPGRASMVPWIAMVAIVGIAGATVAYVVGRDNGGPAPPAASLGSAPTPPTPTAPSERANKVDLLIIASPPDAVITLDGSQLSGNPFRARVARSTELHKIRVESEGYASQEKACTFDENSNVIKILLARLDEGKPHRTALPRKPGGGGVVKPASTPTAAPAATSTATAPSAGDRLTIDRDHDKPSRPIDDKDPYAQ